MRALTEGRDDVAKAVADTNALITKMPALYDQIGAGGLKPAALKPVGEQRELTALSRRPPVGRARRRCAQVEDCGADSRSFIERQPNMRASVPHTSHVSFSPAKSPRKNDALPV